MCSDDTIAGILGKEVTVLPEGQSGFFGIPCGNFGGVIGGEIG